METEEDRIKKMESRIAQLEAKLEKLTGTVERKLPADKICIVCFSGEWDRLFAAFSIAIGGLSLGMDVHMFFTFWGASVIHDSTGKNKSDKSVIQKLMSKMLPGSIRDVPLSKMNFGGLGKKMIKKIIKEKGIENLEDLMLQAKELGACFYPCETSLEIFEWDKNDLIDDCEKRCGVATFLSMALKSKITLFI